jgi:hypothetical protein
MRQRARHKQIKTVYQGMIVMPDEAPELLRAAAYGDSNAAAIMSVIANWLKQAAAITDPNKIPLCLDCDTAFTGVEPPAAFAVLMPFISGSGPDFITPGKPQKKGNSLTTGICARCAQRDGAELLAKAMDGWRTIIPDAQAVPLGRS